LGFSRSIAGEKRSDTKEEGVCVITYELQGGKNSILNPERIQEADLPITLESPKKAGYNFVGWYADKDFEEHISEITILQEQTLYAKWTLQIHANQNVQDYPYNTKNLLLKNLSYQFFYQLDTPGNPGTRIADLEEEKYASEYQCPQGLCLTPDYIIVSSYALEEDALGSLTFYDKETGQYLMTFGMEANSHLGGIAYDGNYIWICHSNTKKLEAISYDFLQRLIQVSNQNFIDITSCFAQYEVENVPSCITAYQGKLYVATHRIYTPGSLYCYVMKEGRLEKTESFLLPTKVQGISFDDAGRVWLSRSYGRTKSSELSVYQDLTSLKKQWMEPDIQVEMPPGSEEIVVEGDICYVLFETASYKYLEGADGKGTCDYPIDKLLMINCHSIWYD
jgi:uncharacterized repeat protein (TIGR02543 family)